MLSTEFEEIILLHEVVPHGAALNMAIDEVLLESLEVSGAPATPMLRVYRWEREAVSFGYFEQWQPIAEAHPGQELVRRWTGGGVVPHGDGVDWTYSLLVPRCHPFIRVRAAESYCQIHQRLAEAMAAILPHQQATLTCEDQAKQSRACFDNPVRHDLLIDQRKVAGGAQRRTRHGLLHQGSVQGVRLPAGMAGELAARFAKKVILQPQISAALLDAARALAATKYATTAWTEKV